MREGRKEGECENERKGVEIGGLKSEQKRLQFCFVLFSFFLFYYFIIFYIF